MKKKRKTSTIVTDKQFKDASAKRVKEYLDNQVECTVYQITITGGTMEMIHGMYYKIKEVYVPSEGIFFNDQGCGMIYVGRYDGAKKLGTITLGKYQIDGLREYIKGKESLERIQKELPNWIKWMKKKK